MCSFQNLGESGITRLENLENLYKKLARARIWNSTYFFSDQNYIHTDSWDSTHSLMPQKGGPRVEIGGSKTEPKAETLARKVSMETNYLIILILDKSTWLSHITVHFCKCALPFHIFGLWRTNWQVCSTTLPHCLILESISLNNHHDCF